MIIMNIHEAKTHFSQLVGRALQGEEVVIARSGKPLLRLMPYSEKTEPRRSGQFRGLMKVPENFDDPLPDEILKQFFGNI